MNAFHSGTSARLHCLDPIGGVYAIILAKPPLAPLLEVALSAGRLSTAIQHERGLTWPDRLGQQIAQASLEHDGVAMLVFASLGDAMACKLRLSREMPA